MPYSVWTEMPPDSLWFKNWVWPYEWEVLICQDRDSSSLDMCKLPQGHDHCVSPARARKSSDKIADLPLGHVRMDGSRSENQACGVRLSDLPGTTGSLSGGVSWETIGSSVDTGTRSQQSFDRSACQGREEAGGLHNLGNGLFDKGLN